MRLKEKIYRVFITNKGENQMNQVVNIKEQLEIKERAAGQRDKILEILRNRGLKGVTNVYFYEKVTKSLGARMSELNERGYGITTRHLGNGMYKYILVSEPLVPSKKFTRAEDMLMEAIEERGSVTADELKNLLKNYGFIISRKSGSKKLAK